MESLVLSGALNYMDTYERMAATFAFTEVSIEGHITTLRRDAFTRAGAQPNRDLSREKRGQRVRIGGMVSAHQHPATAKGFAFLAI